MLKTLEEIRTLISKKFPDLSITFEKGDLDDDYFVVINDNQIFYNEEFNKLLLDIETHYLVKKGISGIIFTYQI